jgi:hypothetical protein
MTSINSNTFDHNSTVFAGRLPFDETNTFAYIK